MIKDQSFDTNVSIDSDEEIKQIEIHAFDADFQYYHHDNTQINIQNEKANQPASSPKYKFMGASYSNEETTKSQPMQTNLSISKLLAQCISSCTIDVVKGVDEYQDNQSKQDNYQVEIVSMQLIKTKMLKNKIAVHNHHLHQTKTRNTKNATTKVRSLSPQGILKKSSFEWPFNTINLLNLQYNQNLNKKVSFELTKEQVKSVKRMNVSNDFINKRSRYFVN